MYSDEQAEENIMEEVLKFRGKRSYSEQEEIKYE